MSSLPGKVDARLARPTKAGLAKWPLKILEAFAAGLMAMIAILVFANATGRYLFARPLPWTEEVVLAAMVWVAGVGVVLAAFRGGMMCCDIIVARLDPGPARVFGIIISLAGTGVMAFFAYATWQFISLFGADLTPLLRMPRAVAMYGLLFALVGLGLSTLVQAIRLLRS